MGSEHTPGEWYLVADGTIRSRAFGSSDMMGDCNGVVVCDLKPAVGCDEWPAVTRWHAQPEAEANARLIAAAPDLLAVCRAVATTAGTRWSPDQIRHLQAQADAVLAKVDARAAGNPND